MSDARWVDLDLLHKVVSLKEEEEGKLSDVGHVTHDVHGEYCHTGQRIAFGCVRTWLNDPAALKKEADRLGIGD